MTMETLRTFFETSTIHGLAYISKTRKLSRLFWIFVVIAGFMGSILLIIESFQAWDKSPVSTTIETLPILELKFPKVTVCPPKNTFTDLNADLMRVENVTFTDKQKQELFSYVVDLAEENNHLELMDKLEKLHEDNRFYNWYHGYTEIKVPGLNYALLNYELQTSAISGFLKTEHYGEPYKPNLVDRRINIYVRVNIPKKEIKNSNVTMYVELEKVPIKGMEYGYDGFFFGGTELAQDRTIISINRRFRPPGEGSVGEFRSFSMDRVIPLSELDIVKMTFMPGFKFKWYYGGKDDIKPDILNGFDMDLTRWKHFKR